MQDPKMKTLDSIIDLMDERMLGAAKSRKMARAMPAPGAEAAAATSPAELMEAAQDTSGTSPNSMEDDELMKFYETEGSDLKAIPPEAVLGTY